MKGVEEYYFYNGPGIQKEWMESNKALLNLVSSKCRQSANASLEAGELVVTEIDESLLQKANTEEEKNDHMAKLIF